MFKSDLKESLKLLASAGAALDAPAEAEVQGESNFILTKNMALYLFLISSTTALISVIWAFGRSEDFVILFFVALISGWSINKTLKQSCKAKINAVRKFFFLPFSVVLSVGFIVNLYLK